MESNTGIKKKVSKTPVSVARIYANKYQKEGSLTAELKQTVSTKSTYPSKSVKNSLQDNLFDAIDDFGYKGKEYDTSSVRVAWIDVPKATTEDQLTEMLSDHDTCIQQILSNSPILHDGQENAIQNGVTTKDVIAESQILRFPKGSKKEGQIILDSSTEKPVYKVNIFKTSKVEDLDNKTSDPDDYYLPESLKKELESYQEEEEVSSDTLKFN